MSGNSGNGGTPSTPDKGKETDGRKEEKDNENTNKLPKTATSINNILLLGTLLLIIGISYLTRTRT
ncbi:LPXTG cell wall anchor domain-containing protein [Sutcliffiella cohnii]|uniref:LPXTG cell wall anchor domain-containing protein n=1 Tax=Sutcliffiella cohnii TaxID=33932 RepID=UPI000A0610BB